MLKQKGFGALDCQLCQRSCCMQVSSDGQFRYANSRWFAAALERLEKSGVHGMAVDVWVGGVHNPAFPLLYLPRIQPQSACDA